MNLKDLFKSIKSSFTAKRVVDIDEFNLHFTLEPLTSAEELKILEVCVGLDGGSFIAQLKRSSLAYAIKKINDMVFDKDIIEYEDENGKMVKETKYICLAKQVDAMPTALRDTLFEAFNNLQLELEVMVNEKVKFERFSVQDNTKDIKTEELGVPKGFRKINEPNKDKEPENETERLNQQVQKEAEAVEQAMSGSANAALDEEFDKK